MPQCLRWRWCWSGSGRAGGRGSGHDPSCDCSLRRCFSVRLAINMLDRYVIRHIFGMTGLVALGLLAIYTFVAFVSDVGDTGQGNYGVLQLTEYTVLLMPNSLYILMPIIALL